MWRVQPRRHPGRLAMATYLCKPFDYDRLIKIRKVDTPKRRRLAGRDIFRGSVRLLCLCGLVTSRWSEAAQRGGGDGVGGGGHRRWGEGRLSSSIETPTLTLPSVLEFASRASESQRDMRGCSGGEPRGRARARSRLPA